jgi:hypothetical protein
MKRLLFLLSLFLVFQVTQAQVTTNGGSGLDPTYPSLAAAITALNAATISSPVVITLTGAETAPAGGYSITASGDATNTISIQGSSSTITAGLQVAGVQSDAIFKIVGGDWITIQNFTMQENAGNTVTTPIGSQTMTEYGVALFLATATNGAQNNTIQNNTISLSAAYPNAIGIMSTSSNSSTHGTLAATSSAGTNSFNKFYSNTISNVAYGMYFICEPMTATIFETGIDIGGSSSSTANTITFGIASATTFSNLNRFSGTLPAGITFRNGGAGNIVRFNSITSNALAYAQSGGIGGIVTTIGTAATGITYTSNWSNNTITLSNNGITAIAGIDFGYGLSTGTIISSNNTITINQATSAAASASITGIRANYTSATNTLNSNTITVNQNPTTAGAVTSAVTGITAAGIGTTVNVNSNIITFKQAAPGGTATYGSGAITYISVAAGSGTVNVDYNDLNTTGSLLRTTGTTYGINHGGTFTTAFSCSNNNINIDRSGASATSGTFYATYSFSSSNITNYNMNNNTIVLNSISSGLTCGIYNGDGGTPTKNLNNNNISITGSGTTLNGIYIGYGTCNVSGNTISLSSSQVTPTIVGIFTVSSATLYNINNNTFPTLSASAAGASGPTIAAIRIAAGTGNTVYSNTIITATTGAGSGSATIGGIEITGGVSTNVYKNKIYGLSTSCSGASTRVSGITISGGGTTTPFNTVYNNLIGDLTAPAATNTDAIRGINITSTTASSTNNIYYNTVYLNASSTGTNFGTTGIFHTTSTTGTTANLTLRNNIIVNNSTASGTGLVVAYRRSAGTASALANYNSASNNNLFYAGTPSATNLIYSDGTGTAQTIAQYKGGVFTAGTIAPRDAASFTENPVFQSTTGSSPNYLKIDLTTPTQIESSGQAIAGITDDYWGTVRNVTTPDVGAFEGDMTPPANLTFVSSTTEQASTSFTVVGATNQQIIRLLVVTEGTENPFAVNSITFNTAGSTSAADIANAKVFYTDAATFATTTQFGSTAVSPSGSFTVTGSQTLTTGNNYFWLAYDIAGGATIGNVVDGQCTQFVTSEAKTVRVPDVTDPAGSRNIRGPLAGTYEVGAGKDYTTITQAVTDLNILGVSSAVTFLLTDVSYSTGETFPIIIQKPVRTNPTDLVTIRPKAGVSSVVSGSSTTGILVLMGADYIVVDGSNSGGTDRSLTWENTNTTASTYAIGLFHNGTVGASNNVIKNNIVKAGSKTVATTWAIILNTAGGGYNNITIQNNELLNAYLGMQFAGISGNAATNGLVTQNVFGSDDDAVTLGNRGILTSFVDGLTFSNNVVKNLKTGNNPTGLIVSTSSINSSITANTISGIIYTGTSGFGGKGIDINTTIANSNLTIANNVISNIRGDGWSALTGDGIVGLRVLGTTGGLKIYYNSINMYGTAAGYNAATLSAGMYFPSGITNVDLRNNIIANSIVNTANGGAKAYAIYNAGASTVFSTINHNDYFASGTQGVLGFLGSDRANIAAWQTATTQDANSISADPLFRSNTNLQPFNGSPLIDAGTPIVGIDVDYLGDDRDDTNPTIGAYENGYNPPAVDWANVQWPPNGNILEGQTHTVYAQVYESGVTEAPGQGAGIECWIGYNNADTDPSTWAEANWTVASFNTQFGNNDEYAAAIGGNLAAGTYYYASRFRITGGLYQFGGYNGGFWNGETNVSGVLTITNNDITWANLQFPSDATIGYGGSADIYARVFVPSVTPTAGASAAIQAWIGWSTLDTDPATWTNWTVAGFNSQQGNNDEYAVTIGSALPVGTYYYASRFKFRDDDFVYGGYSGSGGGYWDGVTNVSGVLTVNTIFPWEEDFQSGTFPPTNWTRSQGLLANPTVLTGTTSSWVQDGFGNIGTTGSAKLNIWSTTPKEWLFTPTIDLGDGSVDYELAFDIALADFGAAAPPDLNGVDDKFAVVISTDNGVTWTSANTLRLWDNAGSPYVYNNIPHTGENVVLDLSSYSGLVKFGFYGESTISNADNDLFVDNVIIRTSATTWNGTADNNWSNNANWSNGSPLGGNAVIGASANNPVLSGTATVNNLTINASTVLSIANGGQLTVNGVLTNSAGNAGLVLQSNASGTGSLIHNTADVAATIQRYITGGQYHFASVPLTAAANPTAALFMNSYLWKYDPTIPDWVKYLNTTDALTVDQGYMIWYTGANTTYSFAGNMNNGAFPAATPGGAGTYNLVPNPYPSAINWTAATGWTKTNVANATYIYNNTQYASYVDGVSANGGTNIIPAGQGFFVRATGAATLAMNNSVRTHSSQAFFNEPVINDLFRVAVSVNGKSDETVVRFTESATASFDSEYDAAKLYGHASAPQLYTMSSDSEMLSINSLLMTEGGVSVPLSFEFSADGEITLQFSGVGSFSEQQAIFIEDLFTGSMTNLRQHGNYSFNHLVSNDPDRFLLHFRDITGLDESGAGWQVWANDRKVYVNIPELNGQRVSIEMFDVLGSRLYSNEGVLSSPTIIRAMNSGVAIIRVSSASRVYTTKIFIQ